MERESYFLPLNSTGLAHYFSRACIIPCNYLQNRPLDIQDLYPDVLLVSANKWVKKSDCSLEVAFTEDEKKQFVRVNDNYFLFDKPIPITRVKKVYFRNSEKKEQTEWNINLGSAIIPENLFITELCDGCEELDPPNEKIDYDERDWSQALKKYDQLLGSMAFMKLGGESYMNYSPNYFQTLSYINKAIKDELIKQSIEPDLKQAGIFTGEGPWSKLTQLDVKKLSIDDVYNYAKAEGIKLEKKFGSIINFDSVGSSTQLYMLAVLATYGDGKIKKIDDLVYDIWAGKFDKKKIERITLLFGYHNGYATLRNKYRIGSSEKVVKFELNSKLDYYTIESIYQFAINKIESNRDFYYLDQWCPNLNEKIKGDNFKILDKVIITKKKPGVRSKEYLEDIIQKISFFELYYVVADNVRKWLPPFASIKKDEDINYFEKELTSILNNKIASIVEKISFDMEKETKPQLDDLKNELEEERRKATELEKVLKCQEKIIKELENKVGHLTDEIEAMKDGADIKTENESDLSKTTDDSKDQKKKGNQKRPSDRQSIKKTSIKKGKAPAKSEDGDIFHPENENADQKNQESNNQ